MVNAHTFERSMGHRTLAQFKARLLAAPRDDVRLAVLSSLRRYLGICPWCGERYLDQEDQACNCRRDD